MPNPNVIVEAVSRVDPTPQPLAVPAGRAAPVGHTVHFQGGQTARLDPADPNSTTYAVVLDELRRWNAPAYVEVDLASGFVSNLLVPLVTVPTAIRPTLGGDVEVELEDSHYRHLVRAGNPDFNQLVNALRAAQEKGIPVTVTDTPDDHEIMDVRAAINPPAPGPPAIAPADDLTFERREVTPARARELFDLVAARTCDPRLASDPCIPFLYPDNGCWARAHEMCHLMSQGGEDPRKVWIRGSLRVATRNKPDCEVRWAWHVAPTLAVATGGATRRWVIDPSLFDQPQPESRWKSVQGDPNATLENTEATPYQPNRSGGYTTDPSGERTRRDLALYRSRLRLRSAGASGPPPYSHCPHLG